jgi:mono/diheme cytochrome c family protein
MNARLRNLALALMLLASFACATQGKERKAQPAPAQTVSGANSPSSEEEKLQQGEERFRTNCGRCHMTPHKFPPRMMATIIRHMRVRAMLTEEDMKLILNYMTH